MPTAHPGPSVQAPRDQASALRAMVASADAPQPVEGNSCPVIAVTSGKGGVGKTTLTVNLATAMAQAGLRVAVVDGDPGLANADLLCGLTPTTRLDAALGRPGVRRTMAELAVMTTAGFHLVPGAAGVAAMANLNAPQRDHLIRGLQALSREHDVILVDTGAGLSDGVVSFVTAADAALVVFAPEPAAMTDAYAMMKCVTRRAGQDAPRLLMLVNQARTRADAESASMRMAATCGRFLNVTPSLVGVCLWDAAASVAAQRRTPVLLDAPKSLLAKELRLVASSLMAHMGLHCAGTARQQAPGIVRGLWRSLLGK
ncbi:MAG: AAA family ATPase [Planctomycetes bacterium]|nr:AAA family ATPase [Planctomycetota bacterium]